MSFGTQGGTFRLSFDKPTLAGISRRDRMMLRTWHQALSDPAIEARRREKLRISQTVRVTRGKKAKVTLPSVLFLGKVSKL
jgi:hypothetical protein